MFELTVVIFCFAITGEAPACMELTPKEPNTHESMADCRAAGRALVETLADSLREVSKEAVPTFSAAHCKPPGRLV